MTVPTLRGELVLSFSRAKGEGKVFALNLTIPGNTLAEVCLPAPLLSEKPQFSVTTNGEQKQVAPVVPPERPGHVCLPTDLGGGVYTISAR
jgi:hypothetical protein